MYYEGNRLIEEVRLNKDYKGIDTEPPVKKFKYDTNGNLIRESYYNFEDQPIGNENKVHAKFYEYDKWNRKTKNYFVDSLYSMIEDEDVASTLFKYDERGNLIELVRYNAQNDISENGLGAAIERYKYDLSDELTQIVYYNKNEEVLSGGSIGAVIYKRNLSGNIIQETYLDERGYPINNSDSTAQIVREYNRNGYVISVDSLSAERAFKMTPKTYSIEFN